MSGKSVMQKWQGVESKWSKIQGEKLYPKSNQNLRELCPAEAERKNQKGNATSNSGIHK
jgi:hypothetical protein